jgi:hypothetical protein
MARYGTRLAMAGGMSGSPLSSLPGGLSATMGQGGVGGMFGRAA